MKIKQINLLPLTLKLNHPFRTNHGVTLQRPITLVEIQLTSGINGYGEIQAFADDSYAPQTQAIACHALNQVLPRLIGCNFYQPTDLAPQLDYLTSFARASVEMALWDAYGKTTNQSLAELIGLPKPKSIPVGTVIGMQTNVQQTAAQIQAATQQGYQKLKFKAANHETSLKLVKLGHELAPSVITTIDANQAWDNNLATLTALKRLEKHGLKLIEEPLQQASWTDYANLQQNFKHLLLSLDESLVDLASIKSALKYNSANAFTIKQGKLGGIATALTAIDLIKQAGKVPWIGGMLTSGLGRSVDLALASRVGSNSVPADISASSHYFEQDFVNENLEVQHGLIDVPTNPGIGVTMNWQAIQQLQTGPTIQYK
ncbi:o-succinylbenzoate synthase [Fructilactobacillus frigidiflavus]|uniref:o-succinylbenzoate synthase n=1 Tax=Fructilactobacillus frigidiflavus TaxID=3242688 RepID=UPI003757DD5E